MIQLKQSGVDKILLLVFAFINAGYEDTDNL